MLFLFNINLCLTVIDEKIIAKRAQIRNVEKDKTKQLREVKEVEELKARINKEIEAVYTRLKDGCKTYGDLLDKIDSIKRDAQFSRANSLETSICDKLLFIAMEEIKMIPTAKVYFYCDGRDEKCNGSDHCYANSSDGDGCRHTTNINHARNFRRRRNNNFWEGMKCDDEACATRKIPDDAQNTRLP